VVRLRRVSSAWKQASLLTNRWGPINQDSSLHKHRSIGVPEYFVIADEADPLDGNTGLFVHTTQSGQGGGAYYAVTSVANGQENREINQGENTLNSVVSLSRWQSLKTTGK